MNTVPRFDGSVGVKLVTQLSEVRNENQETTSDVSNEIT